MNTASPLQSESLVSPLLHRPAGNAASLHSRRFAFREFVPRDIAIMAAMARRQGKIDATAELYRPSDAEDSRRWLGQPVAPAYAQPLHWVISSLDGERVTGYCGLNHLDLKRHQAKLRFWIGCESTHEEPGEFANVTECTRAVLEFAFSTLALRRVYALQLTRQPRTGTILAGVAMSLDGYLRKRIHSRGVFEDIACWSVTADSWVRRFD